MSTATIDPATWLEMRARLEPEVAVPGGSTRLVVEVDIPDGCHIECHEPPEPFLIPTVLVVTTTPGLRAGPVLYPKCQERSVDWLPTALSVNRGSLRYEAPIEVSRDAAPGLHALRAELRYQGCTETVCLPPTAQRVSVVLRVGRS